MKLKSFGCSFIYGSELPDACGDRALVWPSNQTWPALLAKYHNIEYQSFARPGVGNLYIAEQILNECATNESAVFVINWTFIDRFDYIKLDSWDTILPNDTNKTSTNYYQYLHSEYRDKFTTLSTMKLCVDTMLQNNISFVMTFVDDLIFDTQWHTSPAISLLQDYLKIHCVKFDNKNFIKYAQDLGHEITPAGHLLESGHQACYEYAKTHFFNNLINING
jgi:hypothetical protein